MDESQETSYDVGGDGNGEVSPPILLVKADNFGVTTVTSLLKTINFCEKVNVYVSTAGFRFVVEEGKYVQAALFLKAELFRTFECSEEAFSFKIPFKELLDCLKILGGETKGNTGESTDATGLLGAGVVGPSRSMQITYNGHGTPFSLSLEEGPMTTEIELKTEEPDVLIDFDETEKSWDITMDAKLLHENLLEFEGYCADSIVIRVVPNTNLELRAIGTAGSLKVKIPKNSTGIERFCSIEEERQARFQFSILRYSFKLIQAAEKTVLQMSSTDVLSLRLVFKESMGAFGEFHVMSLAGEED